MINRTREEVTEVPDESDFMEFYDSPWHLPCPACGAAWVTHPDRSWELVHTDGCEYLAWLNKEDAKNA